MLKIQTENFSLEQIWQSGQCFRMTQTENSSDEAKIMYEIIAGHRYLEAASSDKECIFYCSEEEFGEFWRDYFDLESNYGDYISRINPRDAYLCKAAQTGWGIRILRQDLWETIVSFLISQQNTIVRIRRCISNICHQYGEKETCGHGKPYYGFPKPETLARLQENDLMACNLGYRSKYVVRAARSVASGELDLEGIKKMPYRKAKEELLKLFGVGEKVADCVCLFGLHHLEAFPVDTHINQALEKHYKKGFPKTRYKGVQGVMQQYIFYYELHGDKGYPVLPCTSERA